MFKRYGHFFFFIKKIQAGHNQTGVSSDTRLRPQGIWSEKPLGWNWDEPLAGSINMYMKRVITVQLTPGSLNLSFDQPGWILTLLSEGRSRSTSGDAGVSCACSARATCPHQSPSSETCTPCVQSFHFGIPARTNCDPGYSLRACCQKRKRKCACLLVVIEEWFGSNRNVFVPFQSCRFDSKRTDLLVVMFQFQPPVMVRRHFNSLHNSLRPIINILQSNSVLSRQHIWPMLFLVIRNVSGFVLLI